MQTSDKLSILNGGGSCEASVNRTWNVAPLSTTSTLTNNEQPLKLLRMGTANHIVSFSCEAFKDSVSDKRSVWLGDWLALWLTVGLGGKQMGPSREPVSWFNNWSIINQLDWLTHDCISRWITMFSIDWLTWPNNFPFTSIRQLLAGSPQQRLAPLRGPLTVPSPIGDRPPHRGLRPALFTNSVCVL